jgi:hypothetical protein
VSDFRPESTLPIYADRITGEQFVNATTMVNAYLIRFAERASLKNSDGTPAKPQLDDTGYAQVQRGSASIGINVLEHHGVLMIFSPIMPVPARNREAFYRRLLELSFVTTSDAAFAINAPHDEVVVRCLRRLSALDYEEFEDLLATVGEQADNWDDVLLRDFGP